MRKECNGGFRRAAEIVTDYSCLLQLDLDNVIRITRYGDCRTLP